MSSWWYSVGVARIQTRINLSPFEVHRDKILYLTALKTEPLFLTYDIQSSTIRKVGVPEEFREYWLQSKRGMAWTHLNPPDHCGKIMLSGGTDKAGKGCMEVRVE